MSEQEILNLIDRLICHFQDDKLHNPSVIIIQPVMYNKLERAARNLFFFNTITGSTLYRGIRVVRSFDLNEFEIIVK